MEKPRDDCCGCGGKGKPVYEMRNLIDMLERKGPQKQEAGKESKSEPDNKQTG